MDRLVCFGEVLIRFTPEAGRSLARLPAFTACVGGAEANVAVAWSRLGAAATMLSTLPANPFGDAARDVLRAAGVDVSGLRTTASGRMGLYFLTPGAGLRPAEVLYDRAGSAFALDPAPCDVHGALTGAARLHVSGITLAVSQRACEAGLALARAAVARGVPVSFDGNYRAKLWAVWGGDARGALAEMLALADVAFVDPRDIALVLDPNLGRDDSSVEARAAAAAAAFAAFPRLRLIAATTRAVVGPAAHALGASLHRRDDAPVWLSPIVIEGVVDRIGAGDAFAAGLLHRLHAGDAGADALTFALYAAAAKHGEAGDMAFASEREVRLLMAQGAAPDVRR